MVTQVGSRLGLKVVHVDVDQMRAGKHKEWASFYQTNRIPFTVLVDGKRRSVESWEGNQENNFFEIRVQNAILRKK